MMKSHKGSKKKFLLTLFFIKFLKAALILIFSTISIDSLQGQEYQEKNQKIAYENSSNYSSNPDVNAAVASIEKFLKALSENDVKEAFNSTTEEFREATTLHQFKRYLNEYPLVSDHTRIEYDFDTVDLDTDHVEIDVTLYKGNDSLLLDIIVDKKGDEWKVDYIYAGDE